MTPELEQFDKVEATYAPAVTTDLRQGMEAMIGRRGVWQAYWIIEEGRYAGEWAMSPVGEDRMDWPCGWAPESDLTDLKALETT